MNYAIILSGGIGKRMGASLPKQYIEVNNRPIILYTLEAFEKCDDVDRIVVVADPAWFGFVKQCCIVGGIEKCAAFAKAGRSRQASVLSGLEECNRLSMGLDDCVIIHDAARPLVNDQLIKRCFAELAHHDGCMPSLQVKDTVYYSENGSSISGLLDRSKLFAGQSPESFKLQSYLAINKRATSEEIDLTRGSSEIAYKNGFDIAIIDGDELNFKITTMGDLDRFKSILEDR